MLVELYFYDSILHILIVYLFWEKNHYNYSLAPRPSDILMLGRQMHDYRNSRSIVSIFCLEMVYLGPV